MSRVLITRPEEDGQALKTLLAESGVESLTQPLFEILPGRELDQLPALLLQANIIIAVSKHALQQAALHVHSWPASATYLAVGEATRQQWQQLHSHPIHCPQPQTSEGLLQHPKLSAIKSANILILRGQSGRELLAQQLRQGGAQVHYCECYQRHPVELNGHRLIQNWQQAGISRWIATSAEQLEQLEQICPPEQKEWLHRLSLITVSPRVAQIASQLGFSQITISQGASNQALIAALQSTQTEANP